MITLPETNSSHLKIGHPKRKRSSSKHPFSGAFAVSLREGGRRSNWLSSLLECWSATSYPPLIHLRIIISGHICPESRCVYIRGFSFGIFSLIYLILFFKRKGPIRGFNFTYASYVHYKGMISWIFSPLDSLSRIVYLLKLDLKLEKYVVSPYKASY